MNTFYSVSSRTINLECAIAQGGKNMSRLAELIYNGEISVEELAMAKDLIERANLVAKGVEACKKTLLFPLGKTQIECYSYTHSDKAYSSWGSCTNDGLLKMTCNKGGNQQTFTCNLLIFESVFMAFDNEEFSCDLKRFLENQIEKASN